MNEIIFLECIRRMTLMDLPVCTSAVTLANAKIMISPGSKLTQGDLKKAGAVTDIIAPCKNAGLRFKQVSKMSGATDNASVLSTLEVAGLFSIWAD